MELILEEENFLRNLMYYIWYSYFTMILLKRDAWMLK